MITPDRPLCIQIPYDLKTNYKYSDLRVAVSETVALEEYSDVAIGSPIQACEATWYKRLNTQLNTDDCKLVKCLEPAGYYVAITNSPGETRYYCEFHKPRVRYY